MISLSGNNLISITFSSDSQPKKSVIGDTYYNRIDDQLYVYDVNGEWVRVYSSPQITLKYIRREKLKKIYGTGRIGNKTDS